jgi:outer membrane protein OmpA-like peptidoglycan-associated protein
MPTMFHYNGNILVDNASSITSCNYIDPALAENKNKNINTKPSEVIKNTSSDNNVTNGVKEENRGSFNAELKTTDLKVGYIFELENLYFQADSSTITTVSEKVLSKLVQFMKNNTTISIEIGGHTNSLPTNEYCDKLSSDRAKNVAEFLIRSGIDRRRITSRGYGKRKPIASNETESGKQRNQRVEIKITDID